MKSSKEIFINFCRSSFTEILISLCVNKVCSKSIKLVAVFTKTEINSEWNIHVFQNTKCVRKYQDGSCIYRDRNEQRMKHSFSSKYKVCSKSIKMEAVLTKTEINNEWNINFLQNNSFSIPTCIPLSFLLIEAPLKLLF